MSAELTELERIADAVHVRICELADGRRKWTMRIPAQADDDDLFLNLASEKLKVMIAEVRRLRKILTTDANVRFAEMTNNAAIEERAAILAWLERMRDDCKDADSWERGFRDGIHEAIKYIKDGAHTKRRRRC